MSQFRGRVDSGGKLRMEHRDQLDARLHDLSGRDVVVTLEPFRQTRSTKANALYWVAVIPAVADHLSIGRELPVSKDDAHYALKRAFLGMEDSPLGPIPKSTKTLDSEQFSDYITRIVAHAASEWGLEIEMPE